MSSPRPHVRSLFRSDLIRVLDYRCAGHNEDGEIPQRFEIVLPRTGAYQRRDAHGSFLADPNQILFYNRGEPYDIRHPIRGGDSSTVFQLSPRLLIEMMGAYDRDVENMPQRLFQRSHITFRTRLQFLQYQLLGAREHFIETLAWEEQIIAATGEIIQALNEARAEKKDRASQKTLLVQYEQTQAVKTFLNANLHLRLQLEQIATAVSLSPFHVCRIFKRHTGMTLHQYLQRLRLFNVAERMLDSPGERLDILALEYGFANHGHFTTIFRQTFGINPSGFRRMSKILKA